MLKKAHVSSNTRPEEFIGVFAQLTASTLITFIDDDIPTGFDQYHNRASYIITHLVGLGILRVLIDNGAALNIYPLMTLERIGIDLAFLESSQLTITAYNGTKRQAKGIMAIALRVGLISHVFKLYVLDIVSSFNLLLGWPWLHTKFGHRLDTSLVS
ncbi:hypothetical protein AMTRI_Chr12g235300 [Amborella trichopoda]